MSDSKRVLILYRFLPQYRVEFYERLRERLAREGIELSLVYGHGDEADRAKGDLVDIPWGRFAPNRIFNVAGHKLYWQPVLRDIAGQDLVIVEQASRLMINYLLQIRQALGVGRVAFWGHGKNFQATPKNRWAEYIKRFTSRHVHWWFAYNDLACEIVRDLGYPAGRITVVQNAIDTDALRTLATAAASRESELREIYGLHSADTCVFIGGMYEEKRLPFLFEAAIEIRSRVPDFELALVGSGEQAAVAQAFAEEHAWAHYLGPRFGREKAEILSLSKLLLLPGLVGLAILDGFATGTPIATTDIPFHSPEIFYLRDGVNGVCTPHDIEAYSRRVAHILSTPAEYEALVAGASAEGRRYTMGAMVENFASGVVSALNAPRMGSSFSSTLRPDSR